VEIKERFILRWSLVVVLVLAVGLGGPSWGGSTAGGAPEGEGAAEPAKGPHGGRLLEDGDLAVEVTIFERNVPPEFRVYVFEAGAPLDPAGVQLTIDLHRFGERVDHIRFAPRDGYLLGDRTVEEPHSFDVEVAVEARGRAQRWRYASYEGRTEISPAAIASSGISLATVGPATIEITISANGKVMPNGDRFALAVPRYPGVVKEMRKRLGDAVSPGEVLAIVESNQSLQAYQVTAPIAGTVVAKNAVPGTVVRDGAAIYEVADLSTVWVDLSVSPDDFSRIRLGQRASIESVDGVATGSGTIIYLSPLGTERTQTLLARVEISNAAGEWRPGLFVTSRIQVEEAHVAVAVKASALQTFRDWDVVFLYDGTVFQVAPLELGRRSAAWVEVKEGLQGGERYAAENSFIVKADVGKSGASHDH
jgi:cobalt-zinc-cadmium efflux system membrane fusion protein